MICRSLNLTYDYNIIFGLRLKKKLITLERILLWIYWKDMTSFCDKWAISSLAFHLIMLPMCIYLLKIPTCLFFVRDMHECLIFESNDEWDLLSEELYNMLNILSFPESTRCHWKFMLTFMDKCLCIHIEHFTIYV